MKMNNETFLLRSFTDGSDAIQATTLGDSQRWATIVQDYDDDDDDNNYSKNDANIIKKSTFNWSDRVILKLKFRDNPLRATKIMY